MSLLRTLFGAKLPKPSAKIPVPLWLDPDVIVQSMNIRGSFYGDLRKDPLYGMPITDEMRQIAHDHQSSHHRKAKP